MSEDRRALARDAALSAAVSEGVFLLVMVGITVWMTRREWLLMQARRLQALVREDWRGWRAEREVQELRRDISRYEHGEA